ncbi:hypothetical protein GW17_00045996 [Ensete ventricosum]|nr:hypothetical protein GW17_00045996 [Ensete ventricosum]
MIAPTEEPKLEDMTLEPKEKDTPQLATRIVLTLAGYTNLQTLKIEGFLEQQPVIILIDAGSTHNFMSNKVDSHLMLQKEDYNGFEVKKARLLLQSNHVTAYARKKLPPDKRQSRRKFPEKDQVPLHLQLHQHKIQASRK